MADEVKEKDMKEKMFKAKEYNNFKEIIKESTKKYKENTAFVIKEKDGTKEEFDNNKIINAVKKSATRMLVELSEDELKEICDFVDNNVVKMNKKQETILYII